VLSDNYYPPSDEPFIMFLFNPMKKRRNLKTHMKQFEVDFETTVPPWHTGHEKYEAEDLATAKMMFRSKHEAARIYKVSEILYDELRARPKVI
jgi:hypothetical protein